MNNQKNVLISELKTLVQKVLETKFNSIHAKMITDLIIFAETSGYSSHGLSRLVDLRVSPLKEISKKEPSFTHETSTSIHLNANKNPGMLCGPILLQALIEKTYTESPVLIGTSSGFQTTTGQLSYYSELAAKKGLISIIMSSSDPVISHPEQLQPTLGTNPLCFGFPGVPYPFVFDMSSSAISFGKVVELLNQESELPKNVAKNNLGKPTRSPKEALKGSLLPFESSHKGYWLAFAVEALSGLLSFAGHSQIEKEKGWGLTIILIDPKKLGHLNFEEKLSVLVSLLKDTKIRIPGERARSQRREIEQKGTLEINSLNWEKLNKLL